MVKRIYDGVEIELSRGQAVVACPACGAHVAMRVIELKTCHDCLHVFYFEDTSVVEPDSF